MYLRPEHFNKLILTDVVIDRCHRIISRCFLDNLLCLFLSKMGPAPKGATNRHFYLIGPYSHLL